MLHLVPVFLVACLVPQQPTPASRPVEVCDSAVLTQTREAVARVERAAAAHRGPAAPGFSARYEGSVLIEGHFMHPGDRQRVPLTLVLECDGRGSLAARTTRGNPATAPTGTTMVADGRVVRRDSETVPFVELARAEAGVAAADVARWFPSTVADAALAARASCRAGVGVMYAGAALDPVTFTDAGGHACTLLIDSAGRIARVESLVAHARLGDVCEWTRFDDFEAQNGIAVPRRIVRFVAASSVTFEYELALAAYHPGEPPIEMLRLPDSRRADAPGFGAPPPPLNGFTFVELAPHLWSAEIAAADARCLIIERATDLVLIDAQDGDDVTTSLLRALATKFPGKPVAIVACGHHHPSPSGGLRAIAATGATIVAPRALEQHLRLALARPTSLGSPAVAGPSTPRFDFFDRETRIDAGANTVRLLDIAEQSAHAFHYVVFFFPESGIVFEDDLGFFPETGTARPSVRLRGFAHALQDLHVKPQRLIQSWPVRQALREVPWPTVEALLAAPASAPASRPTSR